VGTTMQQRVPTYAHLVLARECTRDCFTCMGDCLTCAGGMARRSQLFNKLGDTENVWGKNDEGMDAIRKPARASVTGEEGQEGKEGVNRHSSDTDSRRSLEHSGRTSRRVTSTSWEGDLLEGAGERGRGGGVGSTSRRQTGDGGGEWEERRGHSRRVTGMSGVSGGDEEGEEERRARETRGGVKRVGSSKKWDAAKPAAFAPGSEFDKPKRSPAVVAAMSGRTMLRQVRAYSQGLQLVWYM